MKGLVATLLAPLYLLSKSVHAWKGFNLPANVPAGPCKTQADWEQDFRVLRSLPGSFTSARLYASSDCGTLANAVPAAIATNTKLLVGVWTENSDHFNAEKQALLQAVQKYGHKWIIAVSVGSEDLYRGDTTADALAAQIYDVRGMLGSLGAEKIWVGHVDTWSGWVKPGNAAVIKASDFVGTDGYPYWQHSTIAKGSEVFWQSVNVVKAAVQKVKPGTEVWVAETGWPVSGKTLGSATPSVANAQAFWKSVACQAFREANTFWYTLQDDLSSPSFGVVDAQFKPIYDLSC